MCFRGSFFQRRLFNFRSHSKRLISSAGQAACVSSEWKKDERKTDITVVYVKQPWQWNEDTFSSGQLYIQREKYENDKKCLHWAISARLPPLPSKVNQFQFRKVNSWVWSLVVFQLKER